MNTEKLKRICLILAAVTGLGPIGQEEKANLFLVAHGENQTNEEEIIEAKRILREATGYTSIKNGSLFLIMNAILTTMKENKTDTLPTNKEELLMKVQAYVGDVTISKTKIAAAENLVTEFNRYIQE